MHNLALHRYSIETCDLSINLSIMCGIQLYDLERASQWITCYRFDYTLFLFSKNTISLSCIFMKRETHCALCASHTSYRIYSRYLSRLNVNRVQSCVTNENRCINNLIFRISGEEIKRLMSVCICDHGHTRRNRAKSLIKQWIFGSVRTLQRVPTHVRKNNLARRINRRFYLRAAMTSRIVEIIKFQSRRVYHSIDSSDAWSAIKRDSCR